MKGKKGLLSRRPPREAQRIKARMGGWWVVAVMVGVVQPVWGGATPAAMPAGAGGGADVEALLKRCAPSVHPETMRAVLSVESRGNMLAVADAGPVALPWSQRKHLVRSHYPATMPEAVGLVKRLLADGHTVSIGLAQINDRNLKKVGLTVEQAFEPCANVAAGARILSSFYVDAVQTYGSGVKALRAALSAYNSGSFVRGEAEGYVDLVYRRAGRELVIREGTAPNAGSARVGRYDARVVKPARKAPKDFTLLVSSYGDN